MGSTTPTSREREPRDTDPTRARARSRRRDDRATDPTRYGALTDRLAGPVPGPHRADAAGAVRPSRRRDRVVTVSGLNVLAGIWLIIAPWVLAYSPADPRWNDVVFGGIVGLLALARIGGGLRTAWLSVISAVIGVWLFIAAFTIDSSTAASWNDWILGVVVFVLAVGSATATPVRRRRPR